MEAVVGKVEKMVFNVGEKPNRWLDEEMNVFLRRLSKGERSC